MLGDAFAQDSAAAAVDHMDDDADYETHYIHTTNGEVIEVRIEEGGGDDSGDDIILEGPGTDDDMSDDEDDDDGMSDTDDDDDDDDDDEISSDDDNDDDINLGAPQLYVEEDSDDSDTYDSPPYDAMSPELFPNSDIEGEVYFADAGEDADASQGGGQHEVYWGEGEDDAEIVTEDEGEDSLFANMEAPPMPASPGGPFGQRIALSMDNVPESLGLGLGLAGLPTNEAMGQALLQQDVNTGAAGAQAQLQDMFMNLVLGANGASGLFQGLQGAMNSVQVVHGGRTFRDPGGATRMVFREHADGRLTFEPADQNGLLMNANAAAQSLNDEGLAGEVMFPGGAAALTHDSALLSSTALGPVSLLAQTASVLAVAALDGNN
eukprot:CAMPEP_0118881764 /NCGR_PEP_ID=MMETSP1163-20130328/21162_1 /TAXON_ID=124430 /ORGANISM="Phaeomonas parva, Strain CCMP2877" /LENGTH=377 /DNA_ID=CAMNT_0006818623 /DNA_START=24 /DNA_END=1154 /DNA_ORIENTATION=+